MLTFWPWISGARGIALTALLAGLLCPPGVCAQQLEPRAYSNVPVGLNIVIVGYAYSWGAVLPDPSLPAKEVSARLHSPVVAVARGLNLWGKSGQMNLLVPYVKASVSGILEGEPQAVDRYGFADPILKLSVNLAGAPALSFPEFAAYQQRTILGASMLLALPAGQYNPSKLVNIGANRWLVKPEVGISRAVKRWVLEAAVAATFFEDNDEYLNTKTRAQSPLLATQFHVIYNFKRGLWGAVDGTYYTGGRTTVDGQERADLQANWRWGVSLAVPVNKYHSVKLYGNTGVATRTGTDFDLVGLAWQYRWGGGL